MPKQICLDFCTVAYRFVFCVVGRFSFLILSFILTQGSLLGYSVCCGFLYIYCFKRCYFNFLIYLLPQTYRYLTFFLFTLETRPYFLLSLFTASCRRGTPIAFQTNRRTKGGDTGKCRTRRRTQEY